MEENYTQTKLSLSSFFFFIVVLVLRVNERWRHVRKRSHDDYHRNTRARTVVALTCTQTHSINKHTNTGCAIVQGVYIFFRDWERHRVRYFHLPKP